VELEQEQKKNNRIGTSFSQAGSEEGKGVSWFLYFCVSDFCFDF